MAQRSAIPRLNGLAPILGDGSVIYFGNDQDVYLEHVAIDTTEITDCQTTTNSCSVLAMTSRFTITVLQLPFCSKGTGKFLLGAQDSVIFQNASNDQNLLVASAGSEMSLCITPTARSSKPCLDGVYVTGNVRSSTGKYDSHQVTLTVCTSTAPTSNI